MQQITRRRALAGLSSAVLLPASATALAACGAASTGDAAKPVAIRPDVTLQLIIDLQSQFQPQLAAGNPPDLFQQEVTGAIGLIAKNQVLPLDNYIK